MCEANQPQSATRQRRLTDASERTRRLVDVSVCVLMYEYMCRIASRSFTIKHALCCWLGLAGSPSMVSDEYDFHSPFRT